MLRRTHLPVVAAVAAVTAAGLIDTPAQAAGPTTTSANLLLDGGAESATCTTDAQAATTDPGWTIVTGSPSVTCYPDHPFQHPAGDSGQAYFEPGPYLSSTAMTQATDVSARAQAIDSGGVTATLSGWLGGRGDAPGHAVVSVAFLDQRHQPLGHPVDLPSVTEADRQGRTELLARATSGRLPRGTRSLLTRVAFDDTGGAPGYSQNAHQSGAVDNLSLTLSTPLTVTALTPPRSTVPAYDHVFMIMMENTDGRAVLGRNSDMPFLTGLRSQGASFSDYHAVYHPSDENYLAIAGGATYAHGAVYWPDINDPGTNLADELEHRSKSWKSYEQGMGTACNLSAATEHEADPYYAPDDAPFSSYTDISGDPDRCRRHLVDSNQLLTDLQHTRTTPAFSWIAADDYDDGEEAGNGTAVSRAVQDSWLDQTITPILVSPAWRTQRSLLIVTWDETADAGGNTVATVVEGSQHTVRPGLVSDLRTDHYSTGRTIEEALDLPPMTANDAYAVPLDPAFRPTP